MLLQSKLSHGPLVGVDSVGNMAQRNVAIVIVIVFHIRKVIK